MATKPKDTTEVAVPVDLKALMERAAQAAKAQEKADSKFISFKSGVLSYDDMPAKDNKIQIVILNSPYENNFFPRPYDPDNIVSPDCWAVGYDEDDLAADPDEVTAVEAEYCIDCVQNKFPPKDAKGKQKGKPCKNSRRLQLFQASQLGDDVPTVLYARLPVTSVVNWSKYVQQIANVVKRPAWGVVTEMSVTPDAKTQFKVNFQFVSLIDDAELEKVMNMVETHKDDALFGYPKNDL